MEPLATVFGRRLRLLRKAKRMTQENLGRAANIDYKHVGAVERGVKVPSFDAIERIAKALGVEYYELFLPESVVAPQEAQKLLVLIRDIERRGTPAMKEFLHQVLAAAMDLTRS